MKSEYIHRRELTVVSRKVYDYVLTLGQELDLIWASEWSLVKVLFFAARYGPFIDMPATLLRELISMILSELIIDFVNCLFQISWGRS